MPQLRLQLASVALLLWAAPTILAQKVPATGTSVAIEVGGVAVGRAHEVKAAPAAQAAEIASRDRSAGALQPSSPRSGIPKFSSIQLLGLDASAINAFTQWARAGSGSSARPQNVRLSVLDASARPVMEYLLHDAVLSKFSLGGVNAAHSEIPVAEATLTAASMTISPNGAH